MKKQTELVVSPSSTLFVQRVSGQITARDYVRALDRRASERRKDHTRHVKK
jgi:hypothetical protein